MRFHFFIYCFKINLYLEETIYGPMHSRAGVELYEQTIHAAVQAGGKVEVGGKVSNCYMLSIDFCRK